MRKYRNLSNVEEGYLRDHPGEIDDYIAVLFEEYAKDSDTASLLSSLRIVGRVKGVSRLAEASGLSRKGIQKVLSEDGKPGLTQARIVRFAFCRSLWEGIYRSLLRSCVGISCKNSAVFGCQNMRHKIVPVCQSQHGCKYGI